MENLYSDRRKWIYAAFKEHEDSMSPGVRDLLGGSQKGKAIVWGPTQQGKSTLIFDLLGVDSEDAKFKSVLRAGSGAGQSVTSLPTFYEMASGDDWEINGARVSVAKAQCFFKDARQNVGSRRHDQDPARVGIPSRFARKDQGSVVGILDIPGLESASSKTEREMAMKMDRFIKEFPMVLVVMKASNLTSVLNHTSQFPPLQTWYLQPDRFRLVLTHGLTQRQLKGSETLDDVMDYYGKQRVKVNDERQPLQEFLGDRWKDTVVPLDVGKSAAKLAGKAEHGLVGANRDSRDGLIKDVQGAQDPVRYLVALRNSGDAVRRFHDDKIVEVEARIQQATEAQKVSKDEIKKKSESIKELERRLRVRQNSVDEDTKLLNDFTKNLRKAWMSVEQVEGIDADSGEERLREHLLEPFKSLKNARLYGNPEFRDLVDKEAEYVRSTVADAFANFLDDAKPPSILRDPLSILRDPSSILRDRRGQKRFGKQLPGFLNRLRRRLERRLRNRKVSSRIRAGSGINKRRQEIKKLEKQLKEAKGRRTSWRGKATKQANYIKHLEGERADLCDLKEKDIDKLPKLDEIISQSIKKERTRLNNQLLAVQDPSPDAPYNYAEAFSMLSFIYESRQLLGAGDSRG